MHKYANPRRFTRLAEWLSPWLLVSALLIIGYGLYLGLFNSPADYQQGEAVRIMYVHVPAAWLSLFGYCLMAFGSALYLIWGHLLGDVIARAAAPVGAIFCLICLVTGAIWGKPTWGAWWVWDARLTSQLILFFMYIGYIAYAASANTDERIAKAAAILALVGVINIPIIKFSVDWWNTLHQPASVFRADGPTIAPEMLTPLLLMALGQALLFGWLTLLRARSILMQQKARRLQLQKLSNATR